jgi:hypothetical protein
MFGLRNRDSCVKVFKHNKLLTISAIYILECALFVRTYYTDFFRKYELEHNHRTRGRDNLSLVPPPTHLTTIQRNCINQCIKIYNHLPVNIKELPFTVFKRILKNWLMVNAFYDVGQFFDVQVVF